MPSGVWNKPHPNTISFVIIQIRYVNKEEPHLQMVRLNYWWLINVLWQVPISHIVNFDSEIRRVR